MKTKHKSIQFIFLLASIFSGLLFASPELIVINADIRTADPIRMRASAFSIEAGKFTAVGTNEEILKLVEPNTRVLDAEGKSVLPGFIDSHTHLSSGAKIVTGINLTGIREKSVWLDMIKKRVQTMEPGEWLLGGRWDHTFENKGLPTRWELDNVSPNNPVALSDIDGHSMWVNSLAIEKANIRTNSEVPMGGQILLDESGVCLLYTSPSPRDQRGSRMPSSA